MSILQRDLESYQAFLDHSRSRLRRCVGSQEQRVKREIATLENIIAEMRNLQAIYDESKES